MVQAKERKRQSLPRHTLMAPVGRRMGAAIVDVALSFLLTLIFYFAGTSLIFSKSIAEKQEYLYEQDVHSHLFYLDTSNNTRQVYKDNVTYQTILDCLSYYYLCYLTGENVEPQEGYDPELYKAPNYKEYVPGTETLPKDYYTVAWFNKNILEIKEDVPSETSAAYFQYVMDGDNPDKTKIGIRREEHYSSTENKVVPIGENETLSVLYDKYREAYLESLSNMSFYLPVLDEVTLLISVTWVIPLSLSAIIYYAIVPLFTSNSATFGKKIFKLGLCAIDGYSMQKWQLFLRVLPVLITIAGMFFIPMPTYYYSLVIGVVIFMVSVALYAASPKHCALHDYTGRTLVIDAQASVIFDNELEEDEFIKAEEAQL